MKKIDTINLPISILLFTLCFSFFYPSNKVTSVIMILRYASIALTLFVLLLFYMNAKISLIRAKLWRVIPIIYFGYLFFVSWKNGTEYANISTFSALCQFFLIIALFFYLLDRNKSQTFNVLFLTFVIFVVWDLISIINNPMGIENSYIWLLGNKNNHTLYFYILIYLSFLKYKNNETRINKIILFCSVLSTTIATFILDSSTSIGSILLIDVAVILFIFYDGRLKLKCEYALIADIILNAVIIAGQTSFLKNVVAVFKKDLTFSDRTNAWRETLLLINKKPVFGWGLIHGKEANRLFGYVNAHNQLLDCTLCGGIVLLVFFIFVLILLGRKIEANIDRKDVLFNELFFCGILVKMIFEQIAADYLFWVLFLLMMSSVTTVNNKVESVEYNG